MLDGFTIVSPRIGQIGILRRTSREKNSYMIGIHKCSKTKEQCMSQRNMKRLNEFKVHCITWMSITSPHPGLVDLKVQ